MCKALRLDVGRTDLYVIDESDLIEAKVSAGHRYVRQALGQMLDYAAHCPLPISRLTALFPEAPEQGDVRLLHIYGIDCLYWAGGTYKFELADRSATAWTSADPRGQPPLPRPPRQLHPRRLHGLWHLTSPKLWRDRADVRTGPWNALISTIRYTFRVWIPGSWRLVRCCGRRAGVLACHR